MPFAVLSFTLCQFLPPQHLKAKSYWCPGHQSQCSDLVGKSTPAQGRKDNCQILTWKMVPTLSLHFSTFEDIFLPLEGCLCWHSPGSTSLQPSTPDGSVCAAPSRGASRLWRCVFLKAKIEAKILLNPIFWKVPGMKSHQWRNRNNRPVINTDWNCR